MNIHIHVYLTFITNKEKDSVGHEGISSSPADASSIKINQRSKKKQSGNLHLPFVFFTPFKEKPLTCAAVFASSVTDPAFRSGRAAGIMCMCTCECVLSPPVSGEAQLVDFLNGGCLLH